MNDHALIRSLDNLLAASLANNSFHACMAAVLSSVYKWRQTVALGRPIHCCRHSQNQAIIGALASPTIAISTRLWIRLRLEHL